MGDLVDAPVPPPREMTGRPRVAFELAQVGRRAVTGRRLAALQVEPLLDRDRYQVRLCVRWLAAIQPPDATEAILDCLELPSRAPPTAPAVPGSEGWPGDLEARRMRVAI
jgi:hypothetical protein